MDPAIFRSIFVESPLGMTMMSRDGLILAANKAFLHLSGKEKVQRIKLRELILPEDLDLYDSSFTRLVRGETDAFTADLRFLNGTRTKYWIRLHIYPVKSGRQQILVGFFSDISDQKQREADLRREKEDSQKARQAAEKETRIKSDFLANMSHEIRTPIHTITGMSELLVETELDPEQQEYVDQISFSADVLLSLINDILDFSKIEAGKLSLETIDFDLQKMAEDAVDLVALEAHKKGLETAVFVQNDVPTLLKGDPVRLRQIIVNLFNNAVKFTQEGEVVVIVSVEEERGEKVLLRFCVHDTGIGIPEEKRNKLFKVFSQVDSSTTRKYGGTGLGLSISKNLAQLMNGVIGVKSAEGAGSIFWFTAELRRQGEENFYKSLPAGYFKVRALIVDDHPRIRGFLKEYLQEWGCTVEEANDGPAALSLLREAHERGEDFDICFVDLLMPRMDGWQFASEVNADEALVDVNLVLMSPTGKSGDEAKMKLLHWFRSYLNKPIKKSRLFETLFDITNEEETPSPEPEISESGEAVELVEEITGGTILVAEDHEVNQQLFKTILENLGHEVHLANNGSEAVKAVQSQRYDLIFMDVQMPEMNGYEATQAIRSLNIDTPIIAVTASALRGEEEKSSEVGMNDFLVKPFKKKDLIPVLEKWFDESRRQQGSSQKKQGVEESEEKDEELEELEELEEIEEAEPLESGEGEKSSSASARHGEPEQEVPAEEGKAELPYEKGDPVVDLDETLETFMGQREVVSRLIRSFSTKVGSQIEVIEAALGDSDFERIREEAHAIKGGSLNLAAVRLGKTAGALESAAHSSDEAGCRYLIPLLKEEFRLFSRTCERALNLSS